MSGHQDVSAPVAFSSAIAPDEGNSSSSSSVRTSVSEAGSESDPVDIDTTELNTATASQPTAYRADEYVEPLQPGNARRGEPSQALDVSHAGLSQAIHAHHGASSDAEDAMALPRKPDMQVAAHVHAASSAVGFVDNTAGSKATGVEIVLNNAAAVTDHAADSPMHSQLGQQLLLQPHVESHVAAEHMLATNADSSNVDSNGNAQGSRSANQIQPMVTVESRIPEYEAAVSRSLLSQPANSEPATAALGPLQKGISVAWRDCNSPISSQASGQMSEPDADSLSAFEDLDMHSLSEDTHSTSSLHHSSSSADEAWESMHQQWCNAADVLTLQSYEGDVGSLHAEAEAAQTTALPTQAPELKASITSMLGQQNLHQSPAVSEQMPTNTSQSNRLSQGTGKTLDLRSTSAGPAHDAGQLSKAPLSGALPQGKMPNALSQQGMAAATAQLLLLGSQWGSNLGSLCNLGLILSPAGFILLTPEYEIIKIIGEGAYGMLHAVSNRAIATDWWHYTEPCTARPWPCSQLW